jgi:predicted 3-demethylubiquinone-9 3-methyltransferase (glyoxalase superfamily)
MGKIAPWLWFDGKAEEAATFYTSIFKDSRITDVKRWGEGGPMPAGSVLTVSFEICGQQVVGLNGGPEFGFTEAFSFYVDCEDQAEVDDYWDKLTADGGEESQCGWLKDKFGLSWQIIPSELGTLMSDPDPEKAGRVTRAMLGMRKIDVQALRDAYEGR